MDAKFAITVEPVDVVDVNTNKSRREFGVDIVYVLQHYRTLSQARKVAQEVEQALNKIFTKNS